MGAETLPLWLLFWIYSQMYENYFATKAILKNPENICWTKKTGFSIMKTSEILCGYNDQTSVQMHSNFDRNMQRDDRNRGSVFESRI